MTWTVLGRLRAGLEILILTYLLVCFTGANQRDEVIGRLRPNLFLRRARPKKSQGEEFRPNEPRSNELRPKGLQEEDTRVSKERLSRFRPNWNPGCEGLGRLRSKEPCGEKMRVNVEELSRFRPNEEATRVNEVSVFGRSDVLGRQRPKEEDLGRPRPNDNVEERSRPMEGMLGGLRPKETCGKKLRANRPLGRMEEAAFLGRVRPNSFRSRNDF